MFTNLPSWLFGVPFRGVALIGREAKRKEIPVEETRTRSIANVSDRGASRDRGQSHAGVEARNGFAKSLSADEILASTLDALVYREYLDPHFSIPNKAKLVPADVNEPPWDLVMLKSGSVPTPSQLR